MMNKLKQRRLELGYTQNKVACKLDVPTSVYQRYEGTDRVPNARTAIKIAKALKTTVEYLYGD